MDIFSQNKLKKKILHICKNRGRRENDIILARYIEKRINDIDESQQKLILGFLDENDDDIFTWISDKTPPPQKYLKLVTDIKSHI